MNGKAVAVTAGGVIAGIFAFLSANFTLTAKSEVGVGILAAVVYVLSAIFHVPGPVSGKTIPQKLLGK